MSRFRTDELVRLDFRTYGRVLGATHRSGVAGAADEWGRGVRPREPNDERRGAHNDLRRTTMSKNKIMIMAASVLVAASCATPAWADPTVEPTGTESTSTADPTTTDTVEPTETEEPTETVEPTKTETEKPAVTVTVTETAAPTTTVRPGKDDPVDDPCEWKSKWRPAWCPAVAPTVAEAAR